VYVDALVLRDRDTDGNGTLDERLYPLQDANWNVTALVSASGTVVERYSYDPYGQVTVRDASGDAIAGSARDWVFLHQGGEQIAAGDYEFRNRTYSPSLGRWLTNDPIGFDAGDNNWYRYEGNDPRSRVDPSGLLFEGPWQGYPYAPNNPPAHRITGLPDDEKQSITLGLSTCVDSITFVASTWTKYTAADAYLTVAGTNNNYDKIIQDLSKKIGNKCIESIVFSGHGSPGSAGPFGNIDEINYNIGLQKFLSWINSKKCTNQSTIKLRCCYTASKEVGQQYIRLLSDKSGMTVIAWDGLYFVTPWGNKHIATPRVPSK
jgi:RHS repeat-associated protein